MTPPRAGEIGFVAATVPPLLSQGRLVVESNTAVELDPSWNVRGWFETYQGPLALNPFHADDSIQTPYLPGLVGGAEAYGLAEQTASELFAEQLLDLAPEGTLAALVRVDAASLLGYNDPFLGHDLLLLANLADASLQNPRLGVGAALHVNPLLSGGFAADARFGGAGDTVLDSLPPGAVYVTAIPDDTTFFTMAATVEELTLQVNSETLEAGQVMYLADTQLRVRVDQTEAPDGHTAGGRPWQKIGQVVVTEAAEEVVVQIDQAAPGVVAADAVRLISTEPVLPELRVLLLDDNPLDNRAHEVYLATDEPMPPLDPAPAAVVINSDLLTVTGDGDGDPNAIYGVSFSARITDGLATMLVPGDLQIGPDTISVVGANAVEVIVGGDLWIDPGASFIYAASGSVAGPGGGTGGSNGSGAGGGVGGAGGAGGEGGSGSSSTLFDGAPGARGAAGGRGTSGLTGGGGGDGAGGYANPLGGGLGGLGGDPGRGGSGGFGGSGGNGGTIFSPDGGDGNTGFGGQPGQTGGQGQTGLAGQNDIVGPVISGGGGGGGGGGGAGGGGGGAGGGGGGGGGGQGFGSTIIISVNPTPEPDSNDADSGQAQAAGIDPIDGLIFDLPIIDPPILLTDRGGDGGDGGRGANGRRGGPGAAGGAGGAGGGALSFVALGELFTQNPTVNASGSSGGAGNDAQPTIDIFPLPQPGQTGAAGSGDGGDGGDGGGGGITSFGGLGGDGAAGGGGAGGTLKLFGSSLDAESILVFGFGGLGQVAGGFGRVLLGANDLPFSPGGAVAARPEYFDGPREANPFVTDQVPTPYIPRLVGGPAAYGLLTEDARDVLPSELFDDAPDGTRAVLLRAEVGPAGYGADLGPFDALVIANLTADPLPMPQLTVGSLTDLQPLMLSGNARNPLFGGAGPEPLEQLPPFAVYMTLVPNHQRQVAFSIGEGILQTAAASSQLNNDQLLYLANDATPSSPLRLFNGSPREDNLRVSFTPNEAPEWSPIADRVGSNGSIDLSDFVTDPEGAVLEYSAHSDTPELEIDFDGPLLVWSFDDGFQGTAIVTAHVLETPVAKDGTTGRSSEAVFTITTSGADVIIGNVFADANGDGIFQPTERGFDGVPILVAGPACLERCQRRVLCPQRGHRPTPGARRLLRQSRTILRRPGPHQPRSGAAKYGTGAECGWRRNGADPEAGRGERQQVAGRLAGGSGQPAGRSSTR